LSLIRSAIVIAAAALRPLGDAINATELGVQVDRDWAGIALILFDEGSDG
jgi:hypothetical protein